jgi:hypothetical protein
MEQNNIIKFKKPEIIGHYKCVVCENPSVAIGWDGKKGEYIFSSKLERLTVSCHWIFFCSSCYADVKNHVRKNKQ